MLGEEGEGVSVEGEWRGRGEWEGVRVEGEEVGARSNNGDVNLNVRLQSVLGLVSMLILVLETD